MIRSHIEAHLFGSIKEDEECDYDHTWIDDSSAQGGDKENCSVGEDNSNIWKYVVIETKLMQLYIKMWSCKISFNMPWMFYLMNLKMLKRSLN